jgi:hypothetical protein
VKQGKEQEAAEGTEVRFGEDGSSGKRPLTDINRREQLPILPALTRVCLCVLCDLLFVFCLSDG